QPAPGRRNRMTSVWALLTRVAPDLDEWAAFFAAGAAKRAAAEAGISRAVTARDADDLLRAAEQFTAMVEVALDLPHQPALIAAWAVGRTEREDEAMVVLAPTGLPDRAAHADGVALADRVALAGQVRRASDLARDLAGDGPDQAVPVAPELRPLLPGLRRG